MTREQKIIEFLNSIPYSRRWCNAGLCGCMGCVNGSERTAWYRFSNGEPPITYDEFVTAKKYVTTPEAPRESLNISFKSYPKK